MNEPSPGPARSVIALTSAKQMRALAHPLRMQVLGELRVNGPRTVGQLSDLFDEAPGTLSYHLGKLAEFGFVEEALGHSADRRERWWRSTHDFTDVPPRVAGAPAAERLASVVVRHQIVDVYAATLHSAIDAGEQLPEEWAQAAFSADTVAFLTADELAQAGAELRAVADKWHDHGVRGRADSEAVQLIVHAFRRP